MRKFLEWIKQEESGQGMVEYGIIVALVVVIALAVFNDDTGGLGSKLTTLFNKIGFGVEDAGTSLPAS